MSTAQAESSSYPEVLSSAPLTVARTLTRAPETRPGAGETPAQITRWLLGPAREIADTTELFDELCWRLVGAGIAIGRSTLHMRTLHPMILAVGRRWRRKTGVTEELRVAHGVRELSIYRNSPMWFVFEERRVVRSRIGPEGPLEFPILAELRDEGLTDYLAMPIVVSAKRVHGITWASERPGGFSEAEIATLTSLAETLALLLDAHAAWGVARNLLDAYLGRLAGRRVLAGEIVRGSGETIRAVIWNSDLRGFARLSDRLPAPRVIELLNLYFERVVAPIHAAGGEVLKFMGDGLLAIFPLVDASFGPETTARAIDAATAALIEVDKLRASSGRPDEPLLDMVVVLHVGEIYFGNIGAPDRVDFTAIGPAVNVVARLEQLAKRLGRRLLVTDEFQRLYPRRLESLGLHHLRGLAEPREVFAPVSDRKS